MRYVAFKNLAVGMELATAVYDDKDAILLRAGSKLSDTLLNRLKSLEVRGLYINDELGRDIDVEPLVSQSLKVDAVHALVNKNYNLAIQYAKDIVQELKQQKNNLMVNYINDTSKKNYTCHHAVDSCIYAVIIGVTLGLTEEQLNNVAVAAMLQDVGKLNISSDILHKKGSLTDKEFAQVKTHPRLSYNIVNSIPDVSSVSRNAILFHHENIDGSGYYSIPAEKQTYCTRIVHMADVFTALLLDRPYRKAYSIPDAVGMIMTGAGTLFASEVVAAFVSKFPLYPLGVTVNLSNGEKAIIVDNSGSAYHPKVRVFNEKEDHLVDLFTDKRYLNVAITGIDN